MPTVVSPTPQAIATLRNTPLFASLDEAGEAALCEAGEWMTVDPGEVLFRLGDPGDSLYVVLQGRLEAALPSDEGERVVAIAAGDSVGELALLTGATRTGEVRATRHSLLLRLSRERFVELARVHPEVMFGVARVVSERLANPVEVRAQLQARVLTIIGEPGPWLDVFIEGLLDALPERPPIIGQAEALAGLGLAAGGGEDALGDRQRVAAWLATLEAEHELLILRAEPGAGAWTRACLSLTDLVWVIARAESTPRAPDPSLARADGTELRRVELVLIHAPDTKVPQGTRRWLDAIHVDGHHHLRRGHARDLARLCRRLTGTSIAAAFGGGAARGLAHLGVLQAFDELGVPIDLCCGTSFGSVVGGLVALDHSLEQITEELGRYFSDYTLLRPAALPVLSMLSGAQLESMCEELFGGVEVEDTWLPYFSAATNLGDARPEYMRSGSMAFAVQASGSVPGMWPPVFRGSQVLVDGVISNNLPGDVIASDHRGKTVAVNLIPREDPLFTRELMRRSNSSALLGRLNPFDRSRPPLLPDLTLRSLFISTVRHAEAVRRQVDLFIEPDVGGFGFVLEASRRDQIVAAGYRAGRAALASWEGRP